VALLGLKKLEQAYCLGCCDMKEGVCCLVPVPESGIVKLVVRQLLGSEGQNPTNIPPII
jgi:hypothetical protein